MLMLACQVFTARYNETIMANLPGDALKMYVSNDEVGITALGGDAIVVQLEGNLDAILSSTDDISVNTVTTTAGATIGTDLEIDGALNHDGTTIGFFAGVPAVKTALVDAGALTGVAITDSSGGTPASTLVAVSGSGDDANVNNNFASLAEEVEANRVDMALVHAALNAALDALQTYGL